MLGRAIVACAIVLGGLGMTVPALAASIASCRGETFQLPDGRRVSRIEAQGNLYVAQLRRQGYDVDQVEDWGGCVKAFVNQPNGSSSIMFFDPDTLEPLSTN